MKELIKSILKLSPIALSKNHLYDIQTKKILKTAIPKNANCVDIGCFKGEILDLMLHYAPDGHHIGVEPIPEFFNALREKYKNTDNCKVVNYAASNTQSTSSFNYVVSNPSYSGLIKRDYDKANEEDTSIEVKTELLDHLIPEDTRVDLIKIDVEGAELRVLEGAKRIISTYQPLVVFEHGLGASNHYDATPEKVFHYFQQFGMGISTLTGYLNKSAALSEDDFHKQYHDKINYYFIAHPVT